MNSGDLFTFWIFFELRKEEELETFINSRYYLEGKFPSHSKTDKGVASSLPGSTLKGMGWFSKSLGLVRVLFLQKNRFLITYFKKVPAPQSNEDSFSFFRVVCQVNDIFLFVLIPLICRHCSSPLDLAITQGKDMSLSTIKPTSWSSQRDPGKGCHDVNLGQIMWRPNRQTWLFACEFRGQGNRHQKWPLGWWIIIFSQINEVCWDYRVVHQVLGRVSEISGAF